jgi:hypothetical protein
MFRPSKIFIDCLFGQKDIYIENNNKYITIDPDNKKSCDKLTKSISNVYPLFMKNYDFTNNIQLSAFTMKADYIENDIEQNFNNVLNGRMDVYFKTTKEDYDWQNKYLGICEPMVAKTEEYNRDYLLEQTEIILTNKLENSRFILQIDGLTGDLIKDIENTFLGKNKIKLKLKKYNKFLNVKNDKLVLSNEPSYFTFNCFHKNLLNCCYNKINCNVDCDELIRNYCFLPANKKLDECSCINSSIYPQECFDKRCLKKKIYKTNKMINNMCINKKIDCNYYRYIDKNTKKNIINKHILDNICYPMNELNIKKKDYNLLLLLFICILFIMLFF